MQTQSIKPTMPLVEAGKVLGIGRNQSYELARTDSFPVRVLRIGSRYRVSRYDLERYLGADVEGAEATA